MVSKKLDLRSQRKLKHIFYFCVYVRLIWTCVNDSKTLCKHGVTVNLIGKAKFNPIWHCFALFSKLFNDFRHNQRNFNWFFFQLNGKCMNMKIENRKSYTEDNRLHVRQDYLDQEVAKQLSLYQKIGF